MDSFTKLLLHCEGTDASTTFTDSSASPHTVTAAGNAQVNTAQFKFGAASALFDGTGDYLQLDGSSDFAFGSGDFTIDLWVRFNSVAAASFLYDSRPSGTDGLYPTIYRTGTSLRYFTNSADRITGATVLATGTWYHVEVSRSGTSTKMFLNGTQEGSTYSDSNSYLNGTSRPLLGIYGFDASSSPLNGWLDEIRASKGIARHTADFTPPTRAYADFSLTSDHGTFALNGQDAAFSIGLSFEAEFGSFALNGQDATFRKTAIMMPADYGTFALSGQDVVFSRPNRALAAECGMFALSGQVARFSRKWGAHMPMVSDGLRFVRSSELFR